MIISINLAFSLFFVWVPTFIYPPSHKQLRDDTIYLAACIISIIPIFISAYMWLGFSLTEIEKVNSLIGFSPITFLMLYKQFDKLSIEEYKRNIYFSRRYGGDEESRNQTWSEMIFQCILVFTPFLWIGIGLLIFK